VTTAWRSRGRPPGGIDDGPGGAMADGAAGLKGELWVPMTLVGCEVRGWLLQGGGCSLFCGCLKHQQLEVQSK
jgi:hypothetical protein